MVKSHAQADSIQQRRVKAGRPGWARAVRRFLWREHKEWYAVNEAKRSLPFLEKPYGN